MRFKSGPKVVSLRDPCLICLCVSVQQTPERTSQSDAVYEVVSLQREAERCKEEKGHLTLPTEEEEAEEGSPCHCLFIPASFSHFCFSFCNSNKQSNCAPFSAVSCAAGMQAAQATILAVRLQPFVHMTQFQHRNINRAGIFHQTTGSPVQVLHFRPAYICRQQSVSHFSFHSVASFFSASEDGLTFSLI